MSKPLALLYFTRDKTEIANDIAARIRNEGNVVNMVFAGGFRGPEQCIKCEAIILQASFGRAATIVDAYRELWPETEVHLYNDEGEFDDEANPAGTDTSAEEGQVDPPLEIEPEEVPDDAKSEESDDSGESPTVTE